LRSAHGGDGNWQPLCKALCGGYNQVTATVDCYLHEERFHSLPDKPPSPFKASGQEVDLVSFARGVVRATPGFSRIRQLPSFVLLESHVGPGSTVSKTVDLVTDIGSVILMHPDNRVLEEDVRFIRDLEEADALFEYEDPKAKRPKGSTAEAATSTILLDVRDSPRLQRKLSTPADPPEMYW